MGGRHLALTVAAGVAFISVACSSGAEPTVTPEPTSTPIPTRIATPAPEPTATPEPTSEPDDLLFRYTSAIRMVEIGQYEEAIPRLDIVIRFLPTLAQAYYGRGVAFINQEQTQEELGLADLNKAIELKADYAEAYHERGALLLKQNKTDTGTADLRQALDLYEADDNDAGAAEVRRLLGGS